jgi:hypothetical protein
MASIREPVLGYTARGTEKAIKTNTQAVNKFWHGGCIQVFNGEANTEWRSRTTRNGDRK